MTRTARLRKTLLAAAAISLAAACQPKEAATAGEDASRASAEAAASAPELPASNSPYAAFRTGQLERLELDKTLTIPKSTIYDIAAGKHSLEDFKGKVLVLNIWATWCATCVEEMPTLAKLQTMYPNGDVAVVPLAFVSGDVAAKTEADKQASIKTGAEEARAMLEKLAGKDLPFYYDTGFNVTGEVGSASFPLTVIYDRTGKEAARLPWPADWASPEAKGLIDAVLAAAS